MHRSAGVALVLGAALALTPVRALALDAMERAALHAAMMQHIDQVSVDGVWWQVDVRTGQIRHLSPAKSHAMILQLGDTFVLCTDFVSPGEEPVNVDFYAARRDGRFVVFQTEIGNRAPLQALVAAGRATMLE